jgi:hypothetical protein
MQERLDDGARGHRTLSQDEALQRLLHVEAADLLVPFMFILWQATTGPPADAPPCQIGVRVTGGHNAGTWRVSVGPDGLAYEAGAVDDLPAVLDFDPGSFVLTAFGRSNAGTINGDVAVGDHYLNVFFRI